MDINKIAKKLSKNEFLNLVIGDDRFRNICPEEYSLKETDCNCACTCTECWENAIKDIKFKGDTNMEFNWNEFKKGKVAVFCKTKSLKKDFLQKGTDVGLTCYNCSAKPINHCTSYDNIPYCYAYDTPHTIDLAYDKIEYFIKNNYKIIDWEIENKIDYDREYNILEVIEFEEGTEFQANGLEVKVCKAGNQKYLYPYGIGKTMLELTDFWINQKYKLVKKDKKVSFEEAIQAYGKEVYCIWNDGESKTEYRIESPLHGIRDVEFKKDITPEEILNGEWYIKEE